MFFMMLMAGGGSAYLSYRMGQEALKAVTQPDASSGDGLKKKKIIGTHKGLKLVNEKEILAEIYSLTRGTPKSSNQKKKSR